MLAYLQLLRLPTVFTAMADIFLGFLLTHAGFEPWPKFAGLLAASSCLYLAGMVFNDVFDVQQDLQERPTRPIPSGRVTRTAATILGGVLMIVGLQQANLVSERSLHVAVCLVPAILAYDGFLKRTPLGPLGMGTCRFLNVMLGASDVVSPAWSAAASTPAFWCAVGLGIYIVGVTWFARTEAKESSRFQLTGALLTSMAGIGLLAGLARYHPDKAQNLFSVLTLLGLIAANVSLRAASAIAEPIPSKVQPMIKLMLLSYVMLCAAMVYWHTGNGPYAFSTACLVIPALLLGKIIPMT